MNDIIKNLFEVPGTGIGSKNLSSFLEKKDNTINTVPPKVFNDNYLKKIVIAISYTEQLILRHADSWDLKTTGFLNKYDKGLLTQMKNKIKILKQKITISDRRIYQIKNSDNERLLKEVQEFEKIIAIRNKDETFIDRNGKEHNSISFDPLLECETIPNRELLLTFVSLCSIVNFCIKKLEKTLKKENIYDDMKSLCNIIERYGMRFFNEVIVFDNLEEWQFERLKKDRAYQDLLVSERDKAIDKLIFGNKKETILKNVRQWKEERNIK